MNLPNGLIIRDATLADVPVLSFLMTDLGYPTTVAEMELRFDRIITHPDYKTMLVELNGEVVAMAGLTKGVFYEKNNPYMRIAAFVVSHKKRGIGIGKALIAACEGWARQNNLHTIIINSGNRDERKTAHLFYQSLGYEIKSSGFVKELV